MSRKIKTPSSETLARLRDFAERRLTREEVEAVLRIPIGEEERAEVLALVAWFRRRYPTPKERLAYVRRAYSRMAS
jgi:hypothetical protein